MSYCFKALQTNVVTYLVDFNNIFYWSLCILLDHPNTLVLILPIGIHALQLIEVCMFVFVETYDSCYPFFMYLSLKFNTFFDLREAINGGSGDRVITCQRVDDKSALFFYFYIVQEHICRRWLDVINPYQCLFSEGDVQATSKMVWSHLFNITGGEKSLYSNKLAVRNDLIAMFRRILYRLAVHICT